LSTLRPPVKVAYVFSTSGHTASYKLGKMILPQLEQGSHGVDVVGMFFFDDNTYLLREGDPIGERLGRVAAEHVRLCRRGRSLACGWAASRIYTPRWPAIRPTRSSRCSRPRSCAPPHRRNAVAGQALGADLIS